MSRWCRSVRRTVRFTAMCEGATPLEAGPRVPLPVMLSWRSADPHTVTVTFRRPQPVRWVFSRCLLAAGLRGPAGLGDVSVFPDLTCDERVELILSSPGGRIGFLADVEDLEEFLRATWALVPAGQESRWLSFDPRRCAIDGDSGSGVPA